MGGPGLGVNSAWPKKEKGVRKIGETHTPHRCTKRTHPPHRFAQGPVQISIHVSIARSGAAGRAWRGGVGWGTRTKTEKKSVVGVWVLLLRLCPLALGRIFNESGQTGCRISGMWCKNRILGGDLATVCSSGMRVCVCGGGGSLIADGQA